MTTDSTVDTTTQDGADVAPAPTTGGSEAVDYHLQPGDHSESELEDMQRCRADLRERFLWAMTGLTGSRVEVDMLEKLHVSGTLRGVDKDCLLVHTEQLKTPMATLPWATLRLPDCLALKFPLDDATNAKTS